jgi:hypothetical protein
MDWTTFLIYLLAVYVLYYLVQVLLDLLFFVKPQEQEQSAQIYEISSISEPIDASIIMEEEVRSNEGEYPLSSGELDASGAQKLDDLMAMARAEAIEYIKKVPLL